MLHGDSVTQAPSSFGSIIPTGLEPVKGEQQHRGSRLLPQKLPTTSLAGSQSYGCSYLPEGLGNTAWLPPSKRGRWVLVEAHSSYHRRKFTLPYFPALTTFVPFAMWQIENFITRNECNQEIATYCFWGADNRICSLRTNPGCHGDTHQVSALVCSSVLCVAILFVLKLIVHAVTHYPQVSPTQTSPRGNENRTLADIFPEHKYISELPAQYQSCDINLWISSIQTQLP